MSRHRIALLWFFSFIVALNAAAATKTWTGAVNNLWSTGGNWNDGIPPVDGDALVFPQTSSNPHTVNDITGLDLTSVLYRFTAFVSSASGNAITLSSGLTMECCSSTITWSIPVTLTASQTFGGGTLEFAGPVELNSHTLTFAAYANRFSGSLNGTGTVLLSGGTLRFTGTANIGGTFTVATGATLNILGSINATSLTVSTNALLIGNGTLPATTSSGTVRPGDPGLGGVANPTGIIATGPLTMNGGRFEIDIKGTAPGTNFDQLSVTGSVTLNNPLLQVTTPSFTATPGQTFIIIANDGTDPVSGTFQGLPQGAVLTTGGNTFRISYAGGDGNDVVLTALATTSTTLTSSKNPTVAGEPFTLTATVTSGSGTPTGTVRFRHGTTTLATAPVAPGGTATATLQLTPGTYSIVAEYEGGGAFLPSTSAPVNQVVERGSASISVSPNPATIAHGAPLTLTIDVTAAPPATGTPAGTVTVSIAGTQRTAVLDSSGRTIITLPSLPAGLHTGTVNYGGDANFAANVVNVTVEVLPVITIGDAAASAGATSTTVSVPVHLSAPSNQTVRVDYATVNGTAVAGADYVAASGTIEFAPGQTSRTIVITILPDPAPEGPEAFRVVLSNPQRATIGDGDATITITNITAIPTLGTLALMLTAAVLAIAGAFVLKH